MAPLDWLCDAMLRLEKVDMTMTSLRNLLKTIGSRLLGYLVAMLRAPHLANYTSFGPFGLTTGQFGAIGRGRVVRIERPREYAVPLEREWGWI